MGQLARGFNDSYGKFRAPGLGAQPTSYLLPIYRYPEWLQNHASSTIVYNEAKTLEGFGSNGKPIVAKSKKYKGEDTWGFGIHSNGSIDCINVPLCSSFHFGLTWTTQDLWDNEVNIEEREQEKHTPGLGFKSMLQRLLVVVTIDNISQYKIATLPNTHFVQVSGGPGMGVVISDGTPGRLVLKQSIDKAIIDARNRQTRSHLDPTKDSDVDRTWMEYASKVIGRNKE